MPYDQELEDLLYGAGQPGAPPRLEPPKLPELKVPDAASSPDPELHALLYAPAGAPPPPPSQPQTWETWSPAAPEPAPTSLGDLGDAAGRAWHAVTGMFSQAGRGVARTLGLPVGDDATLGSMVKSVASDDGSLPTSATGTVAAAGARAAGLGPIIDAPPAVKPFALGAIEKLTNLGTDPSTYLLPGGGKALQAGFVALMAKGLWDQGAAFLEEYGERGFSPRAKEILGSAGVDLAALGLMGAAHLGGKKPGGAPEALPPEAPAGLLEAPKDLAATSPLAAPGALQGGAAPQPLAYPAPRLSPEQAATLGVRLPREVPTAGLPEGDLPALPDHLLHDVAGRLQERVAGGAKQSPEQVQNLLDLRLELERRGDPALPTVISADRAAGALEALGVSPERARTMSVPEARQALEHHGLKLEEAVATPAPASILDEPGMQALLDQVSGEAPKRTELGNLDFLPEGAREASWTAARDGARALEAQLDAGPGAPTIGAAAEAFAAKFPERFRPQMRAQFEELVLSRAFGKDTIDTAVAMTDGMQPFEVRVDPKTGERVELYSPTQNPQNAWFLRRDAQGEVVGALSARNGEIAAVAAGGRVMDLPDITIRVPGPDGVPIDQAVSGAGPLYRVAKELGIRSSETLTGGGYGTQARAARAGLDITGGARDLVGAQEASGGRAAGGQRGRAGAGEPVPDAGGPREGLGAAPGGAARAVGPEALEAPRTGEGAGGPGVLAEADRSARAAREGAEVPVPGRELPDGGVPPGADGPPASALPGGPPAAGDAGGRPQRALPPGAPPRVEGALALAPEPELAGAPPAPPGQPPASRPTPSPNVWDPITSKVLKEPIHRQITEVAAEVMEKTGLKLEEGRLVTDQLVEHLNSGAIPLPEFQAALEARGKSMTDFTAELFRPSVRDAAQRLQALSHLSQRLKKFYDAAGPEGKAAAEAMSSIGEQLDAMAAAKSIWKRIDNIRRGLLVTQISTSMRNVETQGVRMVLEIPERALDAAIGQVLHSTGLIKEKPVAHPLDGFRLVGDMMMSLTKRGHYKQVQGWVKEVLDAQPQKYEDRLFGSFASDLGRSAKYQGVVLKGTDAVLSKVEAGVDALNVLNRTQEFFFRNSVFKATMLTELRNRGLDFEKLHAEGKAGLKKIPEEAVDAAVKKALELTFSKSPEFGSSTYHLIQWVNKFPGATLVLPFPRFMYNALKFQFEYSPLGPLKLLSKAERAKVAAGDTKVISQAALGTAMLLAAYQIRDSDDAGERWYEYKSPGGRTVDLRPFNPFAGYLFLADIAHRARNNTLYSLTSSDIAQGVLSTNLRAGTGLAMLDQLFQQASSLGNRDQLLKAVEGVGGELVAGFLTPFQVLTDLVAQFDESQQVRRERRGEPFLGPIKSRLGFLGADRNLPEYESPTREAAPQQDFPGVKQLTGLLISDQANPLEKELARLKFSPAEVFRGTRSPEADRLTKKFMGELVEKHLIPELDTNDYLRKSDPEKGVWLARQLSAIRARARALAKREAPDVFAELKRKPLRQRIYDQALAEQASAAAGAPPAPSFDEE